MTSEKTAFKILSDNYSRFDIITTNNYVNSEAGFPDFKCVSPDGTKIFFVEVKTNNSSLSATQKMKILDLISRNVEVYVLRILENKAIMYSLDSKLVEKEVKVFSIPEVKNLKLHFNVCIKCKYEWEGRVEIPKECPSCKCRNWKAKEVVENV